jgi:hypothetical protein
VLCLIVVLLPLCEKAFEVQLNNSSNNNNVLSSDAACLSKQLIISPASDLAIANITSRD